MKKLNWIISVFLIMLFVMPINVKAQADEPLVKDDSIIGEAFAVAENLLRDYYYAIELYQPFNASSICDERCMNYIDNKVFAKQLKSIAYGTDDIYHYNISFSLIEAIKDQGYLTLKIKASAKYNYKEADMDSAYNELCVIVFSLNDMIIVDFVSPYDYYDLEIRGENPGALYDLSDKEYNEQCVAHLNYVERIKEYYEEIREKIYLATENKDIPDVPVRSTLYSLNRSAMVTWAASNYNATLPTSGNSTYVPTYVDFPSIDNAYDCTNFVSHSILAGGSVVYDTGGSGISSTGWYCRNISNRASSWAGVSNLHAFLTSNSVKGPAGTEISYSTIYAPSGYFPYQAGDLMQFHNGSVWRHSALITGYWGIGGAGVLEAAVTDRTNSTTNHYNRRESEVYPGEQRRVIVMQGYYN